MQVHAGRARQSDSPAGRGWYRQGAWCQLVRTMAGEDGLHRQASWLEVMCDVERKARSVDADTIIMADGALYDSTYDDVYH